MPHNYKNRIKRKHQLPYHQNKMRKYFMITKFVVEYPSKEGIGVRRSLYHPYYFGCMFKSPYQKWI